MGKQKQKREKKPTRKAAGPVSAYAQKIANRAASEVATAVDRAFEGVSEYLDRAMEYTDRLRGYTPPVYREKLTPLSTLHPSTAKDFLENCANEAKRINLMQYDEPIRRRFLGAFTTALGTKPVRAVLDSKHPKMTAFSAALVDSLTLIAVNYRKNPASGDFSFMTRESAPGEFTIQEDVRKQVNSFARNYFKHHWGVSQ